MAKNVVKYQKYKKNGITHMFKYMYMLYADIWPIIKIFWSSESFKKKRLPIKFKYIKKKPTYSLMQYIICTVTSN